MKLVPVQLLRAFAALLVVMHHAQGEAIVLGVRAGRSLDGPAFEPSTLPWPAGVDVFFVISGFIIVHAAKPLYGQPGGRTRFLAHRIARLVPLYWLVTGIYLAFVLAMPGLLAGEPGRGGPEPGYVVASFLFWPMSGPDGSPQPLYSLGWTLNCEMAFYLLFAVGLGWGRRAAFAWIAAALSGLVAAYLLVPGLPMPLVFWGAPIVLEFALGAAIGLARAEGLRLSGIPSLCLAVAGLVLLSVTGEPDVLSRPLAYGLPACLLVMAAGLGPAERPGTTSPPMRWAAALGDASYALYLTHPFVLRGLRETILRLGLAPTFGGWASVGLALALAILVSLLVHRLIERPLVDRARRLLDPGPRGMALRKTV